MKGTPRQRNPYFSSPESTARHAWATPTPIFVARGCSAARLGNTVAHFRCPRVRHDTFRRHFRPFLLPVGVGQDDVRMKGTLRQRNPYFSSPECKVRHAWVTLPSIFVARGCSAARLGNTSVHFRLPRVRHDTLERHFRAFSSPEGAARHAWVTLLSIFVAQECGTTCSGDTSVHFCCPWV